ncbi:MAG: MBL fold metallo-hydrolase [Spirochaetes bacterium]|nr:MBL fold metallo-hydrolase [Spirochaetota bacterium]
MKRKKLPESASKIAILILLSVSVCMCSQKKKNFTELNWKQTVSDLDRSSLYEVNFKDGIYFNPWLQSDTELIDALSWNMSAKMEYNENEISFLPEVIPDSLSRVKNEKSDFMLWIGHQSYLIQLSGELFLLDPVLTKRALVPARKTPPALTISEINSLNREVTVLITHNHYDHLDSETIRKLRIKKIIVPMGLGDYVKKLNDTQIIEMNWWSENFSDKGASVISLPAQHWSNRFGFAKDSSLWCSYLLSSAGTVIYLGGDSGYFHGFREIGRKYKINYAVMSAGAYHPRWFMHYSHLNIEESLLAFKDMKAEKYILGHWGTFKLGDEPAGYPAVDLKKLIDERKLPAEKYKIPDIGEMILLEK